VAVRGFRAATVNLDYDALIISTGAANGFWRQPGIE